MSRRKLYTLLLTLAAIAVLPFALALHAEAAPAHGATAEEGALSVWIAGDEEVAPNEECAWQAIVSGGSSPYSYHWWGALTGSSATIFGSLRQSSWLKVEVTDQFGAKDTANIDIFVDESYWCDW